jgi:hypothetical protein
VTADAPKRYCKNTLFISVLTGLQLSECDRTIFYLSEQACGDETALVDVPARREMNGLPRISVLQRELLN